MFIKKILSRLLGFIMSLSNDEVFSALHSASIFPSNEDYDIEVQSYLWSHLDPCHCHLVSKEVEAFASAFKRYAKSMWDKCKRSLKTIRSSHKNWLAKEFDLPTVDPNCVCVGCNPGGSEPMEDEVLFNFSIIGT